jgi:hypothetical protein
VGHIASFDLEGHREVTYWIGREDWGRGLATRALQEFMQVEATRPLYARAASDNAASIRVLTKCGFRIVGEGRVRPWAQRGDGRGRAPTRCMNPTAPAWASAPECHPRQCVSLRARGKLSPGCAIHEVRPEQAPAVGPRAGIQSRGTSDEGLQLARRSMG